MKHQHLIIHGKVRRRKFNKSDLELFIHDLVKLLNMDILIKPNVVLSQLNAWTGICGIVTSHIAFHYWIDSFDLQFDIYSCKQFDTQLAIDFINRFWHLIDHEVILIDRDNKEQFKISRLIDKSH